MEDFCQAILAARRFMTEKCNKCFAGKAGKGQGGRRPLTNAEQVKGRPLKRSHECRSARARF